MVKLTLPTNDEDERTRRFRVIKNYVQNIDLFIRDTYGDSRDERLKGLLNAQNHLLTTSKVAPPADEAQVKRLLRLSWAAEAQLRAHGDVDAAVLPYANAWGPVHAYYACYMSGAAWLAALGQVVRADHVAGQNAIGSQLIGRKLVPMPWSITVAGCPPTGTTSWNGLPPAVDPTADFELLADPGLGTFYARYCKMLETTRKFRLEGQFAQWRKQTNRKRMPTAEKEKFGAGLPETTLFNFLARLRLRSNYVDVDWVLSWTIDTAWHRQFHRGMLSMVDTTCLLVENLLVRRCGKKFFERATLEFMKNGGPVAATVLESRRALLLT